MRVAGGQEDRSERLERFLHIVRAIAEMNADEEFLRQGLKQCGS